MKNISYMVMLASIMAGSALRADLGDELQKGWQKSKQAVQEGWQKTKELSQKGWQTVNSKKGRQIAIGTGIGLGAVATGVALGAAGVAAGTVYEASKELTETLNGYQDAYTLSAVQRKYLGRIIAMKDYDKRNYSFAFVKSIVNEYRQKVNPAGDLARDAFINAVSAATDFSIDQLIK